MGSSRRKIMKERLMSKVEGSSSKTKMMMGKKRVRYIIMARHFHRRV
jgi:hypothetical protein